MKNLNSFEKRGLTGLRMKSKKNWKLMKNEKIYMQIYYYNFNQNFRK